MTTGGQKEPASTPPSEIGTVLAQRYEALRELGPIHFARYAIKRGEGAGLRAAYADVCDLCAHVASDPTLTKLARDSAVIFRKRWAKRVADKLRK